MLQIAEDWGRSQAKLPKQMRSYEDSAKSKKTVSSMIERKGDNKENKQKKGKILLLDMVFKLFSLAFSENISLLFHSEDIWAS